MRTVVTAWQLTLMDDFIKPATSQLASTCSELTIETLEIQKKFVCFQLIILILLKCHEDHKVTSSIYFCCWIYLIISIIIILKRITIPFISVETSVGNITTLLPSYYLVKKFPIWTTQRVILTPVSKSITCF